MLSTIKAMNKVVTRPDHIINTTSVQDTPEKKKKVENEYKPESPKSPCPSHSELPSLI